MTYRDLAADGTLKRNETKRTCNWDEEKVLPDAAKHELHDAPTSYSEQLLRAVEMRTKKERLTSSKRSMNF